MKKYPIKECFYSLQGEGVRAGCPSVFLRFAGCNLKCRMETHGFDCDTDFAGGEALSLEEVVRLIEKVSRDCRWVVLTGGEPALFADPELVGAVESTGRQIAIETNGTVPLKCCGLDWVTVSPKRGEKLVVPIADEVKVVLGAGDALPEYHTLVHADHFLLSPAFEGTLLPEANLRHCIDLCLENPRWRLSEQLHKHWRMP